MAAPAAPASVRKQWENAIYFKGSADSRRIESMCIPPRGISAVPMRHWSVPSIEYTYPEESKYDWQQTKNKVGLSYKANTQVLQKPEYYLHEVGNRISQQLKISQFQGSSGG